MDSGNYTREQVHNAMQDILDRIYDRDIPYINSGGCGWFVHYILKEFERYGVAVEDYWVVYLVDWGFEDEEEIEFNLKNRCGKRSASHLMIRFDDMYYDAYYKGEEFDDYYWDNETEYLVRTNADDMRKACEHRTDWNDTYDYEEYNTELRQIVYSSFRKHLKNG